MDTYTRHQLKQDKFATAAATGVSWMEENRTRVVVVAIVALFVVAAAIVGYNIYASRSESAAVAFGAALKTYESPIRPANAPNDPTTESYANAQERAQTANKEFLAVADKYGWTESGKNARYFAGLTYVDEGQNTSAEATLKQAAAGWDKQLASLAKEALADLYHQTGRDAQAIELYNQLTDHPTDAVPAGLAQIELAELYTDEGKTELAHKIYAQLKDKDKNAKGVAGPAGAIATQKLNPAPTGPQL